MDVVPKRHLAAAALVLIMLVSIVMVISGSLDGAAAWANIIALPVAIISLALMLRNEGSLPPVQGEQDRDRATDRAPGVTQNGYTNTGHVIQVAHDFTVNDRAGSEGR